MLECLLWAACLIAGGAAHMPLHQAESPPCTLCVPQADAPDSNKTASGAAHGAAATTEAAATAAAPEVEAVVAQPAADGVRPTAEAVQAVAMEEWQRGSRLFLASTEVGRGWGGGREGGEPSTLCALWFAAACRAAECCVRSVA